MNLNYDYRVLQSQQSALAGQVPVPDVDAMLITMKRKLTELAIVVFIVVLFIAQFSIAPQISDFSPDQGRNVNAPVLDETIPEIDPETGLPEGWINYGGGSCGGGNVSELAC